MTNFNDIASTKLGDAYRPTDPAVPVSQTLIRSSTRSGVLGPGTTSGHTLIDASDTGSGWVPVHSSSRLSSGEIVPGTRFRIVRWIGEGGMGQVFEAIHVDIQRKVALKVLRSKLGLTPDVCSAFLSEARACARVSSRFVVSILDFGVLPDDRPFFAMELLSQTNLRNELNDGPMGLDRAIPILRQICKALAAIHEHELVHRDIKPQNIIVQTEDGRHDTVRVVDFGIAARLGTDPVIAGTPNYMAPEQVHGQAFDGRLDIYALGCTAYELLSGAPPFEGSPMQVLEAQLRDEPPAITTRCSELPSKLDPILLKCLAKDPDERWPNVHEFEAALCSIQIELGLLTPWDDLALPEVDVEAQRSLAERMPQRTIGASGKRRWLFLAGAVTLATGLVIGTSASRSVPSADASDRNAAEQDELILLTDAVRVAASRAHWVHPPTGEPGEPTALYWITQLEAIEGSLSDRAQARADELRIELAETLARLGDKYWAHENGRSFAAEYYTLALIFVPGHAHSLERSMLTTTQLSNIMDRAVRGDFSTAELRIGEIVSILADEDDTRRRERLDVLMTDSNFPLSLRTRESLAEFAEEATAEEAPEQNVSDPPSETGETDETDETGETGETGETDETGDDTSTTPSTEDIRDPEQAQRRIKQAQAALAKGRTKDAERLFNEALASDSESVEALAALAELYFDAGQYRAALSFARSASRRRPRDADLQLLLGDCYLKVLHYAKARAAYERASQRGHAQGSERLAYLDKIGG